MLFLKLITASYMTNLHHHANWLSLSSLAWSVLLNKLFINSLKMIFLIESLGRRDNRLLSQRLKQWKWSCDCVTAHRSLCYLGWGGLVYWFGQRARRGGDELVCFCFKAEERQELIDKAWTAFPQKDQETQKYGFKRWQVPTVFQVLWDVKGFLLRCNRAYLVAFLKVNKQSLHRRS